MFSGTGAIRTGVAARLHPPGDPLRYSYGVEYRNDAGLRAIAAQLPGKPLVSPHPEGMISEGARARVIGKVIKARLDGDHVAVECDVTPEGQTLIDGGNRELSVGYNAGLDAHRFQTDIQVDHLAAVPMGRCGPECRFDHADVAHGESMSARKDEFIPGSIPVNLPDTQPSAMQVQSPGPTPGAESYATTGVCKCSSGPVNLPGNGMSDPTHDDAKLNAKERHALPAKHFAVPSREGLPIEDEGHVKAAMSRFDQEKFSGPAERKSAFHRIVARAHELGVDPSGFQKKYGSRLDDADLSEANMDAKSGEDMPSGGGEAGRSQFPGDPGFSAPDMHAKLTAALEGMKELQVKHSELTAKYDELKQKYDAYTMARQTAEEKAKDAGDLNAGVEKARADKAEKERDEHKLDAYNARKDLQAEKARADKSEKDLSEHKDRADKAEKDAKDAKDKSRFDADTEFQSRVVTAANVRADLLMNAARILGSTDEKGQYVDRSKMSDGELKSAIVKHVDSEDVTPTDPDLHGMYRGALGRSVRVAKSFADVRQTLNQNRLDNAQAFAADSAARERAAQAEMTKRTSEAWTAQQKH